MRELKLQAKREDSSGKPATAANRTREIRLSGMRGGLVETWAMVELGTHCTTERVQTGHSPPKSQARHISTRQRTLEPIFEPVFEDSSYGYRPRSHQHKCLDALGRTILQKKLSYFVEADVQSFFDEVNHDILMARIGRKVKDKRIKRLINAYLKAGVMEPDGLHRMGKGTPQGGPLSPLLSNILLDDLDKELERRGHSFCRYADDCNIYVRTQRSGERVMDSVTRYIEKVLKLKVNPKKSAVARPWKRTFLGFTFIKVHGVMRLHIPDSSLDKFRHRVKDLLHMGRGRNVRRFIQATLNPMLRGWLNYFRLGASKRILRQLDFWIRRCMRCLIWRQWKRPRTRIRKLLSLGCSEEQSRTGWTRRGPWPCAGMPALKQALDPAYFRQLNLFGLLENMLQREATST